MLFSSRLSLSALIELCRAMRHNLGAGLSLLDVFRQLAKRGSPELRVVAERIRQQLEQGASFQDTLDNEKSTFPPLFLALGGVGEQTGHLPEVFGELEKYFVMQQRLKRQFIAQSMLPILQLVAAIGVIALLILILGLIPPPGDGLSYDPVGLGLKGPSGALTFLGVVFGTAAGVFVVYLLLTRLLKQKAAVDAVLLRVPAIGPCLEALALARFCLGLRLTMETAISMVTAVRLSLMATGNAAFAACTDAVKQSIRAGEDLTVALGQCRLFPEEFLNVIAVAEEGGRVPEVMRHQAEHYEDEAARRLSALTRVAGFGVWLLVAIIIIIAIFRIFSSYVELLNKF